MLPSWRGKARQRDENSETASKRPLDYARDERHAFRRKGSKRYLDNFAESEARRKHKLLAKEKRVEGGGWGVF